MRDAAEPATAGSGSDWSLHAVRKILWSRRWLILAIAAEVFLVTGLVTFLKTPLYEASARLLIERSAPKVLQGEDVMPTAWNEFEIQRFYQTQYLLLKDPALLRQALDRHGVREALWQTVAPKRAHDGEEPAIDDNRLAGVIRDGLKVEQVEYSNIVRVSFRHPRPDVAANVVNAVIETYRNYFVNSGLDARKDASTFLAGAIQDAQSEVMDLDSKLAEARGKFTTVLPSAGGNDMGKGRLESIDTELTGAKARLAKAEARLAAYQATPAGGIDEVRTNPQVQKFKDDLGALKKDAAELEGRVGADWPRLRELKVAIAETERNLGAAEQQLYTQAVESARAQAEQERRAVAELSRLLETELQRAAQVQGTSTEYEKLRQAYEQKKQALDHLLARREEVALSAAMKNVVERQISIVDQARPPEAPAVPRTRLNLGLGLLFGLFLGVGAAFVAEALDNKVRAGAQLADLTRLPLLGAIPRLGGPARPRLAWSRARRQDGATPVLAERNHDVEESFRALRSALLLAQPGRPPRTLLITSALPGEGKSTVAANLGRTLASFGHRTVVIDCDLRHPRLHRIFSQPSTRGITNVLAGPVPIQDVVVPTSFENLSFVPGGPCPPDPATLLDPARLRQIMADLERLGFEFVIVDTPPVMVFADTFNLVPAMEGVVVVARAQFTPKEAVRGALDSLRKMKAPLIGAVLNGEVTEDHSGSYYRYYHYRRGYYKKAAEDRKLLDAPEPLGVSTDDERPKAAGE